MAVPSSPSNEFVKALYSYNGADQEKGLSFSLSTVLLVAQRTEDGWCRGACAGAVGWFPASYVKTLDEQRLAEKGIQPSALAAVIRSPQWLAYSTEEDKLYYVSTETQATTWTLPDVSPPQNTLQKQMSGLEAFVQLQSKPDTKNPVTKPEKTRKPKYKIVNGLTFLENGPEQSPLNPSEISYVDHFWSDKGDQSGFDIILTKQLNGKFSMKDMIEFFRERAQIEEQYAKSLMKLSKSTLADQEEGTLKKAWLSVKAELRHRSEAHSKFANEMLKELEKPMFEFKESQKKGRKEHQQIMEKSRKLVQSLEASIEKTRSSLLGGSKAKVQKKSSKQEEPNLARRRSSVQGDDLKKLEDSYNHAQTQWIDNMINACQDYEQQEDERSDFLKDMLFKYIDRCVAVDESSAESLSRVTDSVERINKQADREYFIKVNGTGTQRPVDATFTT